MGVPTKNVGASEGSSSTPVIGRSFGAVEKGLGRDAAGSEREEDLQGPNKDIAAILERITDAFFALDGGWRFAYLNPEAERLLGREREDLLGKDVWEEFPEALGSAFQREYERAARTGKKVSFEEHYPPLETWFEVNAYPSEGGLSVYFRDVTERKRAEEERGRMQQALLENERRLRAVLSRYSSDVVMVLDDHGVVRHQSPAVGRVLGYEPEALVGEEAFGYIRPDDQERAAAIFSEVLRTPGPHGPVEYRFRHADGSWRWMEALVNNLLSDPDVRGIVVNSRDVTERKEAEEALRGSEAGLAAAQRVARLGSWEYDPREDRLLWSDELYRIYGFAPRQFAPTFEAFMGVVHPDDRASVGEYITNPPRGGGPDGIGCRIVRPDGEVRFVQNRREVELDEGDAPIRITGTVQDVTERREAEEALREREERFRTVAESLGEGLLITDLRNNTTYANPRMAELTGYAEEEMLGRPAHELLLPPERWPEALRRNEERLRGASNRHEVELVRGDGTSFWAEVNATPYRDAAGEVIGSVRAFADVTERKRTEEALRRSESNLAAAQELAHVGSWEYDVEKGGLHWSDELYRIYGFAPQEFAPTPEKLLEIVHPDDRGLVEGSLREALRGPEQATVECRIVRPDGEVRFVQNHGQAELDEGGRPVKLSGTVQDVTERKVLEEELAHRASHDPLTGVPNRALFLDRLEHALARARRHGGQVAVLFLDLDDFKSVNDSLGHGAGDRLLAAVADRLRSCLRPEDTAARFGGDEFAVLLEGVEGANEAARVARRIAEELETPFALDGRELSASASIGIALGHPGRSRPEDLLRDADLAMYRAKAKDGVRYEIFRPEEHEG